MTTAGRRLRAWAPTAALAAVCYLPLLLTHPGEVGADTKSYLYFDPSRLLERAWSMWDVNVGLGTVTHQNIGYLWPMGPWFWFFETIGAPDWLAQRLWLGSILFLAGMGVRYLMRTLGQQGPPVAAAMFVYALSPYVLTLAARISALLLPFVGLPWMIGLTVMALRRRDWLHPALFALLVPTIGSTNATALFLAGLGPLLWLPFAVFVLGEATIRQALAVVARIGVLTVATSLWWMAGLWCQGAFGIDVLRYTETARTVADASTAPEVLRGIGYWFFYGDDKLGPWIEPSVPYTQSLALLGATYLLAVIGLASAGVVRWRYRGYFVALMVIGTVVAIGAHPWAGPPLWGRGVRAFLLSDTGLAMRSLPRAVPLLTLGASVLIGAGISAIGAWSRRMARPLAAGVAVLAVLCLPPLWTGDMVASNLQRPEQIPGYWSQAAAHIDAQDRSTGGWSTRVLEVPGADFASYRWGNTVDPITPGISDRPYVARELIPYGTPVSADVLNAFDRQMQESVLDPSAIAPMARFMAAGDLVVRNDLQYERYNLARPRQLWRLLGEAPGLGTPKGFGGTSPNVPDPAVPLDDELELASPPDLPDPPKVAVVPVEDSQPILRSASAVDPVLLDGDAEGLIDAASVGLLSGRELVLYSASMAGDPAALRREVGRARSQLVVTDTNRRSARRWGTVHETNGYTEEAGETPLRQDPADNRLPLFPDAGDDAFTVSQQRGGVSAQSTGYGNPVTYTPEDRAANAIDGDPRTAWTVGGFSKVDGERLVLTYDRARTTDGVRLTQASQGVQTRWITGVQLRFDGGDPVDATLGTESRQAPGQVVHFPRRTFHELSIEITRTDVGNPDRFDGLSSVGFSEVHLVAGDRTVDEVVRLPTDLLDTAGTASARRPLALVLTRQRSRPTAALRSDEEPTMVRAFSLPTARPFTLSGQARLSARATGETIDALLGITDSSGRPIDATESRRLPGAIEARAVSAIDGDPTTAWSPGFLGQAGEFVRYRLDAPISFDHLDLTLINDGRHSVPTRMRIEADGEVVAGFDIPAVTDRAEKGATVTVPIDIPKVSGRDLAFVVESAREVKTNDWISKQPVTMPVGIAELGIATLSAEVPSGTFDSGCRRDLVRIDGRPAPARVRGTVADALAGAGLDLTGCGPATDLTSGRHLLRTGSGRDMGIDVDRLLLASPSSAGTPVRSADDPVLPGPTTTIESQNRTALTVEVGPRRTPSWLVLGQSHSLGWKASVDGKDLGEPQVVNGYANGWLLPAGSSPTTVQLRWAPQRVVDLALVASALAALGCLALVSIGFIRRRRGPVLASAAGDQPAPFAPRGVWSSVGAPPSIRATVLTTAVAGLATAAVIGPVTGVLVALAAAAALHWRRARVLTTLGPAACLAAAAAFVLLSQARNGLPPGFDWPGYFSEVHQVAYAAVALLGLDVVVDRLWTGRWWPRSAAERATSGAAEPIAPAEGSGR